MKIKVTKYATAPTNGCPLRVDVSIERIKMHNEVRPPMHNEVRPPMDNEVRPPMDNEVRPPHFIVLYQLQDRIDHLQQDANRWAQMSVNLELPTQMREAYNSAAKATVRAAAILSLEIERVKREAPQENQR
jgi:hypothetical protein